MSKIVQYGKKRLCFLYDLPTEWLVHFLYLEAAMEIVICIFKNQNTKISLFWLLSITLCYISYFPLLQNTYTLFIEMHSEHMSHIPILLLKCLFSFA